jgi:hypothetical protein
MSDAFVKSASAAALAAALLCSCQGVTGTPAAAQRSAHQRRTGSPVSGLVIGVLFAGWHTGLILPVDELGPLRTRLAVTADERYVSFGWGNRRFYMTRRPSVADALAALFPSASTILVTAAPHVRDLLPASATYRWVCADRREVSRVDRYVLHSLRVRNDEAVILARGPVPESIFVASRLRYDAFDTCNTWTATALAHAGFPLQTDGVLFSSQLKRRIQGLSVCRFSARPFRRGLPNKAPRRQRTSARVRGGQRVDRPGRQIRPLLRGSHCAVPRSEAMERSQRVQSRRLGYPSAR